MYAAVVMAVALLVQRLVWPFIQPSPFLFLTLAVLIASLPGEWAPGLIATGIGAVAVDLLFLPGAGGFALTARDAFTLALFVLAGLLVTWINVARRRGNRAATENEQWLRTTLHSIGDGVIAADRQGRVRFLNAVAEVLTGWRTHQAAGRPLRDVFRIVNQHTRQPVDSPVDEVLRAGRMVALANHSLLIARDGGEHLIEDSGAPILDDEGQLAGVVLVFRDATERAQDDERRALLAEVTEVLIGSLEVETTLAAVARLLVPRAADRVSVHTRRADGSLETLAVAEAAAAARVPTQLVDTAAATGRSQLLATAMVVPLTARGRPFGALAFALAGAARRFGPRDLELAEDLARRVAGAIDSARLYCEAHEAIRLRDEFLAIASHELRTPLTTLQLQLDSLARAAERLPPDDAARLGRKIDSSSRQSTRLANLVDSLLDVSRITTGRLAIKTERMNLVAIAGEIAERFHAQAVAAGCELRLAATEPSIEVEWDRLRIEQVLSNLVANAIKYGAGQPIDVLIDRVDGGRARMVIRDRGIGIRQADVERIFGRYERAVSARNYGGLGLGLFIARQIVEAHGGEIRVGQASGAGAELVVVIPTEVALQRAA